MIGHLTTNLEEEKVKHAVKIDELQQRNTVLWFKAMVSGLRHRKCCTRLTDLQEELDQSERQHGQCASQLKELGRKRRALDGSILELESMNVGMRQEQDDFRKEIEELKTELGDKKRRVDKLDQELDDKKKSLERYKKELTNVRDEMDNGARGKIGHLLEELEELKRSRDEANQENSDLRASMRNLDGQFESRLRQATMMRMVPSVPPARLENAERICHQVVRETTVQKMRMIAQLGGRGALDCELALEEWG